MNAILEALEYGDPTALENLEDLAERVNTAPDAMLMLLSCIGAAHAMGDDFLKAEETCETAAETAHIEEQRAGIVGEADGRAWLAERGA
jgi:hypothetical protein